MYNFIYVKSKVDINEANIFKEKIDLFLSFGHILRFVYGYCNLLLTPVSDFVDFCRLGWEFIFLVKIIFMSNNMFTYERQTFSRNIFFNFQIYFAFYWRYMYELQKYKETKSDLFFSLKL